MKFTDAFGRLGYHLPVPRTDWSAENETGICLSLWRSEIDWKSLSTDTRIHAGHPSTWNSAGNNKRKRHLAVALERYGGWVDVVIVDGIPGQGVDNATPWNPQERRGLRWQVYDFEPRVGHFAARATKPPI